MKRTIGLATGGALALASLVATRDANAQVIDRFSLHVEGGAAFVLTGEQASRFGPGGDVIGRFAVRVVGPLHVQASLGNVWLVANNNDGPGRMYSFEGGLRFAPLVSHGALGGPFVDVNAGLAVTGPLQRFTLDAGIGWLFRPVSWFGIGPAVRYQWIYQPDDQPSPDDAHLLFAGITIALNVPASAANETSTTGANDNAPPADTDRDGVPDPNDRCPTQPEDRDGFRDDDGCPDPDNDGDGFPDATDRCPDQAETRNGFEDDDGCADTPPVASPPPTANERRMEEIGNHVMFDNASHRLRSDTRTAIGEMCTYLAAHPEIVRVRVEGHADERGSADFNQELSAYRSAAVARALVQCGVAPERLESAGVGATHRLCEDGSEDCHQRNRRVQFEILERR